MKARYSSLHTAEQLRKFHLASLLPGEFPPMLNTLQNVLKRKKREMKTFQLKNWKITTLL
jgi:hypothetical protein